MEPKVIVVSFRLPLLCERDENGGWKFDWNKQHPIAPAFSKENIGRPIVWVGWPNIHVEDDDNCPAGQGKEQEAIETKLMKEFNCVPVFLTKKQVAGHYHGFCKNVLWPLFHYTLPLYSAPTFDSEQWRQYCSVNMSFQQKIRQVYEEGDLIWVQDYHLLLVPSFLRRKNRDANIGLFLHSPFPSSEIYRTLPIREELMRAMLTADLIGFHMYDYARHFLVVCSRLLGLDTTPKGVNYFGRFVAVSIIHLGIDLNEFTWLPPERIETTQDENLKNFSRKINSRVQELSDQFQGKKIILGLDELDVIKGLRYKLEAFDRFLSTHPEMNGHVVLLQVVYQSNQESVAISNELKEVVQLINQKHSTGDSSTKAVEYVEAKENLIDTCAMCGIANVVLITSCRDGLNLLPYKYVACQQQQKKAGVLIISEFTGCSRSLSGSIRVNPYNIDQVVSSIHHALTLPESMRIAKQTKHFRYISSHTASFWAKSFLSELERVSENKASLQYMTLGMGLDFRIVGFSEDFSKLDIQKVCVTYRMSRRRVFLLNYHGTMTNLNGDLAKPTDRILDILNTLVQNEKNIVILMSGRDTQTMDDWFSTIKGLGMVAEHGFYYKWPGETEWRRSPARLRTGSFEGTQPASPNSARLLEASFDLEWKSLLIPIFQTYVEQTDGSFIEIKHSGVTWNYREADRDFGSWQANDLHAHLENVLSRFPVDIICGNGVVEVKCQGFDNSSIIDTFLSEERAGTTVDFVLCLGDDKFDETTMEKLEMLHKLGGDNINIFTCTVGNKPSFAKYWLSDVFQVVALLEQLAFEY